MPWPQYLFFLLVEPLRLLFEVIFFYAYKFTGNCGLSITAMSLVVNFLLLPLYFRADKLEKEQNDKKKAMEPRVKLIKKAFRGDERVMMLQAYYRQNNYRSTDVLKESVSLFLQIPFFIAAYSFLSGLRILNGIPLGPIPDLGAPDALIKLGAVSINLLPVLMTVINIISGFIYSEKGHFKDKIKLILIALVFLVLLYNSPAGLVFYWTLNNLFSLCKNIVVNNQKDKTITPTYTGSATKRNIILLSFASMALLTGLMIPAEVISQNPSELVNTFSSEIHSPLLYLINSFLCAVGFFLLWIPLFYYLTRDKSEKLLAYIAPIIAVNSIINYIAFNKNFGLLSKKLTYDYAVSYTNTEIMVNLCVNLASAVIIVLLARKLAHYLKYLVILALTTVLFFSIMYSAIIVILTSEHNYSYANTAEDIKIPMTTTGNNVIVIMMDRMLGAYIPYIFNENPNVAEQFDGFTYYPNTISFGTHTNFAAPALFGGYEYTPEMINARSDELLVNKHNEALRVMPTIFADNGWIVSVGDPPYANYEWIPDVSIYNDNDNIQAYNLSGVFNDRGNLLSNAGEDMEIRLNRDFFCYGMMKSFPYLIQPLVYSDGSYNYIDHYYFNENTSYAGESIHTQVGLYETFISEYLVLESLNDIITPSDNPQNCFFMFSNGATHEVCHLQEPEYEPALVVDNTEYDEQHLDRLTVNGVYMNLEYDYMSYAYYQCNMATCIQLGNWFDYLRENGLYDNTRIIIVADHGNMQEEFDDLIVSGMDFSAQCVNPILMVKDFGSTGFTTSYDFMTNADTPYLAVNGLIDNPVNPFTGNPITDYNKLDDQLIYISNLWNVNTNNGTTFANDPDGYWVSVRNNIWDDGNWNIYRESSE